MKRQIKLTDIQRQYLIEIISIDMEVNGAVPIHDSEVPKGVDICDGTGNSFRSYLIYLLDSDLDSKAHRKINERYWTCGRIGDITEKL